MEAIKLDTNHQGINFKYDHIKWFYNARIFWQNYNH